MATKRKKPPSPSSSRGPIPGHRLRDPFKPGGHSAGGTKPPARRSATTGKERVPKTSMSGQDFEGLRPKQQQTPVGASAGVQSRRKSKAKRRR